MKLRYNYNCDVNKEYNIIFINYLYEKIDKYIILMIIENKNKEIELLKKKQIKKANKSELKREMKVKKGK